MENGIVKRRYRSPQDTKDLGSTAISGGQIPVQHPAAETAETKTRLSVLKGARSSSTKLSVAEICEDLGIARSTFDDWRAKGKGPRCMKLPNGQIRVSRAEYELWLESCMEVAA